MTGLTDDEMRRASTQVARGAARGLAGVEQVVAALDALAELKDAAERWRAWERRQALVGWDPEAGALAWREPTVVHAFAEECCTDLTLCGMDPLEGEAVNGFASDWTCQVCIIKAEEGRS